jgi:hypothetical protein
MAAGWQLAPATCHQARSSKGRNDLNCGWATSFNCPFWSGLSILVILASGYPPGWFDLPALTAAAIALLVTLISLTVVLLRLQRREDDAVAVFVHGLPAAVTPSLGTRPPGSAERCGRTSHGASRAVASGACTRPSYANCKSAWSQWTWIGRLVGRSRTTRGGSWLPVGKEISVWAFKSKMTPVPSTLPPRPGTGETRLHCSLGCGKRSRTSDFSCRILVRVEPMTRPSATTRAFVASDTMT